MKSIKGTSKCGFSICWRNRKLHNSQCRDCNKTALSDRLSLQVYDHLWVPITKFNESLLKLHFHRRFLGPTLRLGHWQSCPCFRSTNTSLSCGTHSEELFLHYASPNTNLILHRSFCILKAMFSPCPFFSLISYVKQYISLY